MAMSENMVLRMENVTMQFGGVVAVNNLSLDVPEGKIVALIGPNGAGKTTAFNCITGVYQPTNGRVEFQSKTMIQNHPTGKMKKGYLGSNADLYAKLRNIDPTPDYVNRLGIARTFQNIRLWKSMTVFDNVLVAKHMQAKQNVFSATFASMPRKRPECGKRPWNCSGSRAGINIRTRSLPAFHMVCSAAWRSPGRWPRTPSSCFWMSRLPA